MGECIYIVDDNEMTSQSLAFFCESLGYETKVWNDPEEFLETYPTLDKVGCIVLDVRMPKKNGLEVFAELKEQKNKLSVIFLTGHGEVRMAVHALKDGAFDFLLKSPEEKELIDVIERALRLSSDLKFKDDQMAYDQKRFDSLTEREKDVVVLVGKGMMNKNIADVLQISEKTVQQHRGSACRKLNLINAVEIADFLRKLKGNQR